MKELHYFYALLPIFLLRLRTLSQTPGTPLGVSGVLRVVNSNLRPSGAKHLV